MPSTEEIVCMHFCKFRKAGSSLKYTHVHLYDAPDGVNGVGHDDERKSPSHPHHTTISRRNKCDFHKNQPGRNGTAKPYLHPTGKLGLTAYFHECDNQECPPGYKRIKCKCEDEERVTEEIWVCYTLDYDTFRRWYESQKWDNRDGSYEYPSTNISGTVPTSIPCDSSIILHKFKSYRINPPADCTGYGGPQDGMNPLIEKIRLELIAATDKISCEGSCQKSVTEVFSGWKCYSVQDSTGQYWSAEALVQWKVMCKS